jgi:hypothetical protein
MLSPPIVYETHIFSEKPKITKAETCQKPAREQGFPCSMIQFSNLM